MPMNELLYGRNDEPNIVAIETLPGKENVVQVFVRGETLDSYYDTYKPFAYTTSDEPAIRDINTNIEFTPLWGNNFYDILLECDNIKTLRWFARNANNVVLPMTQAQYLMITGKTLFKNMSFDDPVRLYLDIEVVTKEGYEFPNSNRPEDTIVIISMIDNRGNSWVLHGEDEKTLLKEFITTFREIDPDIIIGHNIFNFDLPYLADRFIRHRMDFALGRNGGEPTFFDTVIKFAEKSKAYTNCHIYGRAVLDTMFMAQSYDVIKRELPGYGLKEVTKFLGKAKDARVYVEGSAITFYWFNRRQELLDYALDDVEETRVLDEAFGQSTFFQTQLVPLGLQDTARYGTGTKIELMFGREYHHQKCSYPKADPKREFGGGLAGAPVKGLINKRCVYADVGSLYPTMGELLGISPKKDILGIYKPMNSELKKLRMVFKKEAQNLNKAGDPRAEQAKAKESLVKILLNTLAYGWVGWEYSDFNDYDEAERITINGQKVLLEMVKSGESVGGIVVKMDTDGALFAMPDGMKADDFIQQLNVDVKAWVKERYGNEHLMSIGNDGEYEKVLVIDKKAYVLYDGEKITMKGSTLRNRRLEPFCLKFLRESIEAYIHTTDIDVVLEIYNNYKDLVVKGNLTLAEIAKKESLNKSLEEYKNHIAGKRCNNSAVYEVALTQNRRYEKGDSLSYYISTPEMVETMIRKKPEMRAATTKIFQLAKSVKEYGGDYWTEYYLKRLNASAKKLAVFLPPDEFTQKFGIKLTKKELLKLQDEADDEDDDGE